MGEVTRKSRRRGTLDISGPEELNFAGGAGSRQKRFRMASRSGRRSRSVVDLPGLSCFLLDTVYHTYRQELAYADGFLSRVQIASNNLLASKPAAEILECFHAVPYSPTAQEETRESTLCRFIRARKRSKAEGAARAAEADPRDLRLTCRCGKKPVAPL